MEAQHSDAQLLQRGAAVRRPALIVFTALVGAVACACVAGWQLRGGGGRSDELMVLGPLGIAGKMPWVLSGGAEALLKQLTWDHTHSHGEAHSPGRGRHPPAPKPARSQKLAIMDPDDPAAGKHVWGKHEPEPSPFDDLEVSPYLKGPLPGGLASPFDMQRHRHAVQLPPSRRQWC